MPAEKFNKKSLDEITVRLSDVKPDLAYRAFKDYLFGSKIYADRSHQDFWAILTPDSDNMFVTRSDAIPKSIAVCGSHSNKFKSHQSTKTFEMSEEFIKRLDNPGAKELFIERALIKDVLDNHLAEDHAAVLKWFLFPTLRLTSHNERLGKFQKKLDSAKDDTRRNWRTSAIKALINAICLIQDNLT